MFDVQFVLILIMKKTFLIIIADKFQVIKLTTDGLEWTAVTSASTGGDSTYTNVTIRLSRK